MSMLDDATDSQGYKRKFGYMATQMPLPHTIVDFWRLVFDMNLNAIIMLNSLTEDMVQNIFTFSFTFMVNMKI